MKKIRILIADDHSIVREGLRQLLESQPDMEIIGDAEDGEEALEKIRLLHPDIVLLDITMPNINGMEVANLARDKKPRTQIVVFSMHAKESFVRDLFRAGVLGYVLKASPSSDIIEAIRAACRGEYFLSSKLKTEVIRKYIKGQAKNSSLSGYDLLTEREQQIFRLVAHGLSTEKIACLLYISPKTVEKHRSSVLHKLNIQDRFELLKYAIKVGVVDPEQWNN